MKAVKTVMSDHFLLMQTSDSDDGWDTMHESIEESKSQNEIFKMNIGSLEETREKIKETMDGLHEILVSQINLQYQFQNYQKALNKKMNEVIDSFDNKEELKQKLEELQEIINKG